LFVSLLAAELGSDQKKKEDIFHTGEVLLHFLHSVLHLHARIFYMTFFI